MANYWIKLKHSLLDDPKAGTLTDRQYRRMIELFLLAGIENKDGGLPCVAEIAWRLRISFNDLMEDLRTLEQVNIISFQDGAPFVTNFAKHQARMPDAERKRRERAVHNLSEDRTNSVQSSDADIEGEGEIEVDKKRIDKERYPATIAGVWEAFEEHFGVLNGNQDALRNMVNTFDADNVLDAMTYCVEHDKRNIKYLKSVLVGRRKDGKI